MRLKSKVALQFSVEALSEIEGAAFWTLTHPDLLGIRETAAVWSDTRKAWNRKGCGGVRVFELHPGGHGLHVHGVSVGTDEAEFNAVADMMGWGKREWSCPIISGQAAGAYLATYLKEDQEEYPRGLRRWAGFGEVGRVVCSKVKNILVGGIQTDAYREARAEGFAHSSACRIARVAWTKWIESDQQEAPIAVVSAS